MTVLMIILSLLSAVIGVFSLSEATMGVGVICLACLIAIYARIAQAAAHDDKLTKSQP